MSEPNATCWGVVSPLMKAYHDEEWGVPEHDGARLFEVLMLEGLQAGLSWETILRRRESIRAAFDGWDARAVAGYGPAEIERLLTDPGVIRHRGKIEAMIGNARAFLEVEGGAAGFAALCWSFAPAPSAPRASLADLPAATPGSTALSRELRRRGFRFTGPTICYAFMQAAGIVNDHLAHCPLAVRGPGDQAPPGGESE